VDETVKEGEPKVERNFEDRDAKKDADSEEYSARESNSDSDRGRNFFERASERGRKIIMIICQSSPIH
jgi:hypothetical protein